MSNETEVETTDLRRPMRGRPPNAERLSNGEDPQSRAALKAAEIRKNRPSQDSDVHDEFKAPVAPEGWEYQWVRKSVYNQEDLASMNRANEKGWEPVPSRRHPEYLSYGRSGATIEKDGMILMELPKTLVDEERNAQARRSALQVNAQAAYLDTTPNTFYDDPKAKKTRTFSREHKPMEVPE
jgi:hypothetical protein